MKNNELQVVTPTSQAVARTANPFSGVDINALLEKAVDSKAAVEVLERLQVMRRELKAEHAQEAFDNAMSAFQAECPVIRKNKSVNDTGGKRLYDYAPMEQIISEVKPLLQKHGFSYTLDTDVESKDGWVIAQCIVTHQEGHKQKSEAKFPLGAGTRAMSTTQIFAAALTFASRRVFCNAFGIITGDEDRDGAGDPPKFDPGDGRTATVPPPTYDDDANKRKLVDMTRSIHLLPKGYKLDDAAKTKLTQYLIDEAMIADSQTVADLHGELLFDVLTKLERKQRGQ